MKIVKGKKTSSSLTESCRKVNVPENYPWIVMGALVKDLVSVGSLSADDADLVSQIIRDRDVSALRLLSEVWGLQCITSEFPDLNVSTVRARRVLAGLLKKYLFPSDAQARRDLALKKFLQAETACYEFNHGGYLRIAANGGWVADVLTHAQSFCKSVLGDKPDFKMLVPWARFGPGATLNGNGSTSQYFKYAKWPYTVTPGCAAYARFLIESDARWMGALTESYRIRKSIPQHYPLNMRVFWSDVFELVDGNRIGFVPKDSTVDRSIAIEPLLNLRLQLGVDGFIRRRLKRYDIDLDSQTKNQVMASLGSELGVSNRYSTIDLSAASDSVSLKICEMLLPSEWNSFLLKLRSPSGFIKGHGKLQYEKISSMGNGYTFVLESLIFASLVFGVLKVEQGSVNPVKDFAVYGDDLIVPEKYYDSVVKILHCAGFSVNLDKSFKTGIVKESCGTDWFQGYLVRPVTLTKKPESVMDLYVDHNRFQRMLCTYFGFEPGEGLVLEKVRSWIPKNYCVFVGPISDEDFASYLHSPDFKKWGKRKDGRWSYNRLVFRSVPIKVEKWRHFNFRKLMDPLSEAPQCQSPWDCSPLLVKDVGSRFAVLVDKITFTVGKSHRSAGDYWQTEYVDLTSGRNFRAYLNSRRTLRN
jgi:hypothetical protein